MTYGSSCSQRKRKAIALDQKAAIIRAVESGTKKTQVAKDFGIAPSTLSSILSSKKVITGAVARGEKGTRKKLRSLPFEAVEEVLFKWFLDARAANLPVSGAQLQRKARDFGGNEDGKDGLEIAAAAEKAVLRLRKMQQRSTTGFFVPSTSKATRLASSAIKSVLVFLCLIPVFRRFSISTLL
ncbi:hypothetical protein HPB49_003429 [Dermacentor silvarum]|uniref:Uncharacterized protein n=1 Tax=Dermacentor silvarum TaxID=543639 RepID=A0ACB8CPD7_DERSI|nr:hypothetical protein HPB49_003429 [Dermacentor silvarum]